MISAEYTITDLNKRIYNFAFDYLKKKYVKVSSKNITTGVVTNCTYGVHYVVVDKTIELLQSIGAVGDVLRIVRETSTSEQIVSWNDASILKASDMSLSQIQQLHMLEEYGEYISTYSLSLNINELYDAKNTRIINLASPQIATDAVNRGYVDSMVGTLTSAQASASSAQNSATVAQSSATSSQSSATSAKNSATSSQSSATSSQSSATSSQSSATASQSSATASQSSATLAQSSASSAQSSASSAQSSASLAQSSASSAQSSASSAQSSASSAQSWAVESISSRPEGSSKYWSEQSKNYAEHANESFNIRKNNKAYVVGGVTYSLSMPSWTRLDCIQNGTTANVEPTWGVVTEGQEVTDGTVKWRVSNVRNVFPKVSTYGYHYRDVAGYSTTAGVGSNTTGTLKITLPTSWPATLLKIIIEGLNYVAGGGTWSAELYGYNPNPWYNASAILSPNCPFTSVRFGHDGTKCCILLGTTSTVWQFPQITISDVYANYVGYNQYATGWALSFITSETGITMSSTPDVKTLIDNTRTDVFAPAGYGLGGRATGLPNMDLNTITASGFYNYYGSTSNKPTSSSGFVTVLYGASFSVQIATDFTPAITYTRVLQYTTWSPWQRLVTTTDFTQSLSDNGWTKLPNGLIMQWGIDNTVKGWKTITFPIAFPNACFGVQVTRNGIAGATGYGDAIIPKIITTTKFELYLNDTTHPNVWFAIGY